MQKLLQQKGTDMSLDDLQFALDKLGLDAMLTQDIESAEQVVSWGLG